MVELREDLRFAVRQLRKSPGFTAVAVLTLALAIGANTAIFSVANRVVLRPLPYPEPERLFYVLSMDARGEPNSVSVPLYAFLSAQDGPFSRLTAFPAFFNGFNLDAEGGSEHLPGTRVTQSFFEVLGVGLALGRTFLPEEDVAGGPRVAVIGHGLWLRRFGGRPEILGQSLTLDGEVHTIVGVAPPGFRFPQEAEIWTPLRLDLTSLDHAHFLAIVGRAQPEVDLAHVDTQVRQQGEQLRASQPRALGTQTWLSATELQVIETRQVRSGLFILLGAVGMVLLIACVNLASLQLARGVSRERELTVRAALGATSSRLVRHVFAEGVLLAGLGGGLGLLLALATLPALLELVPPGLPLPPEVHLDGGTLAFTLGVSVLTSLLFGLLPARQASRVDVRAALQTSAPRATSGPTVSRLRRLLVVGEVMLAVVLLMAAVMLAKSFATLQRVEPGIDARGVRVVRLSLPTARHGRPEALDAFIRQVQERVQALPGVEAVGFASLLPFEQPTQLGFVMEESPPRQPPRVGLAFHRPVTRGYFEALKIPLVRGRLFDGADGPGSALVVLANEAAVRRYWPDQEPLGQRITIGATLPPYGDPAPRELIGVVKDVREAGVQDAAPAILYVPLSQMPEPLQVLYMRLVPQKLLLRASGDSTALLDAVQQELRKVDALQPVVDTVDMELLVARSLGPQRFTTLLMGVLAGLALVLAAVGLYGVLSHVAWQRSREFGVRLALGATPAQLMWRVMREGLGMVLVGLSLGTAGAVGLTRLLAHLLPPGSALEPTAFLATAAILGTVALVAVGLPAIRASRVDPMEVLRME